MPNIQNQVTAFNPNGINTDLSTYEVPDENWTDGNNVQFDNNRTNKILGHKQVFSPLLGTPYWLLYYKTIESDYWLYPSLTKIFRVKKVGATDTHTDVTRLSGGDYSATAENRWNGGVLGGVAILNNGVDVPQQIGTTANNFSDLSNWLSGTTTAVIRPFKRFLVALDTTESSTRYPFRVRWSHPAEGGTVPTTWNAADATKDAGFVDLSQTPGFVVDCLPLKDVNIIYKEDSVWSMAFEGGQSIFGFRQLFSDAGILSKDCAKPYEGGHFVVSEDDVYIHNGQVKQSVVDRQVRDELFGIIHPTHKAKTFVAVDYEKNEMWVCFVSNNNNTDAFADTAFVWNWRNNTWSKRDLPNVSYVSWGLINQTDSIQWNDSGSWDSTNDPWNFPLRSALVLADVNNTKMYIHGSTNQFDGTDYKAWIEKADMSFGFSGNKAVKAIIPRAEGTGDIDVWIGHKFVPSDSTVWQGPYVFTPGTHSNIPVRINGNYISVRFESTSNADWLLDNFEIHWTPSGHRGKGV
jgi:hypothetical protein